MTLQSAPSQFSWELWHKQSYFFWEQYFSTRTYRETWQIIKVLGSKNAKSKNNFDVYISVTQEKSGQARTELWRRELELRSVKRILLVDKRYHKENLYKLSTFLDLTIPTNTCSTLLYIVIEVKCFSCLVFRVPFGSVLFWLVLIWFLHF